MHVRVPIISLQLSTTSAHFQIAGVEGCPLTEVQCPVTTLTTNPHNRSLKTTRWWGHKWSPGWEEEGHQSGWCPPCCCCCWPPPSPATARPAAAATTPGSRDSQKYYHVNTFHQLGDSDSEWWKEISQSVLKYQLNVTTSTEIIFKLWWMVKSSNSINRPQIVFKGRGIDFNGMGWTIPASIPGPRPYS